jgi:hypothetical protein
MKMAAKMFAETLETVQQSTRLSPENQNHTEGILLADPPTGIIM